MRARVQRECWGMLPTAAQMLSMSSPWDQRRLGCAAHPPLAQGVHTHACANMYTSPCAEQDGLLRCHVRALGVLDHPLGGCCVPAGGLTPAVPSTCVRSVVLGLPSMPVPKARAAQRALA